MFILGEPVEGGWKSKGEEEEEEEGEGEGRRGNGAAWLDAFAIYIYGSLGSWGSGKRLHKTVKLSLSL